MAVEGKHLVGWKIFSIIGGCVLSVILLGIIFLILRKKFEENDDIRTESDADSSLMTKVTLFDAGTSLLNQTTISFKSSDYSLLCKTLMFMRVLEDKGMYDNMFLMSMKTLDNVGMYDNTKMDSKNLLSPLQLREARSIITPVEPGDIVIPEGILNPEYIKAGIARALDVFVSRMRELNDFAYIKDDINNFITTVNRLKVESEVKMKQTF